MRKEFVKTKDGSHSIYLAEMDEHYHSKHGAIAESMHIFIENGLKEAAKERGKVEVFEVGFGTGLNAICTQFYADDANLEIDYESIEFFPLEWDEVKNLNYTSLLGSDESIFEKIQKAEWEQTVEITPLFKLKKIQDDLTKIDFKKKYDLVYFDAFAPEKQAEMWSEEIFKKLFEALNENGILVTYCVKGEIRRRLQGVGFTIEKLPGPIGGKREMCRAVKAES